MKRYFCVLAMMCFFAAAIAATALAAGGSSGHGKGGPPQTLTATCSTAGAVTVRATSGASARVNNSHYLLMKLVSTFTPTGGTAHTVTRLFGNKEGLESSVQTCTGSQTSPMGTFSFTAWVVKTPA